MEQPCVTVGVHFLHLLNIKMFYNKKFTYTVWTVKNRFSESTEKFIFDLYIKKKKLCEIYPLKEMRLHIVFRDEAY